MLSLIYCPLLKGNKPNPSTSTAEITKAPGRDVVLKSVRFLILAPKRLLYPTFVL